MNSSICTANTSSSSYQVFRWDVTVVATAVIILLMQLLQLLRNRLARRALRC